ncbi:MAG TPA: 16S rRNA (guanine(966)-N(2))-methyltransferase RsmD [Nocardioidaceae bacterium]|nr:16S rRNA (guanine(966)-N(2))-methyltransferase RsmD [Nocardioidaceae bacterium]
MTRIIGGSAGGRRLRTPTGESTRPTSDRVREAMFSTLDAWFGSIAGLRFLDLYAGSGAVGLEAMSRGAGVATLVEHDRRTAALIRHNVKAVGFSRVEVVASTVARALAHPPRAPYDIAFLDPPYALSTADVGDALVAMRAHDWLGRDALVVVERSTRDELTWPEGFASERSKRYGETTLWYGRSA